MLAILKQPFPAHTLGSSVRMAAFIGLFVALFLVIFQPFGIREAPGGIAKIPPTLGYGLVTFACIAGSATLLSKLFPAWFRAQNWTVSKEISITLFNFLVIGFCNTLYTFWVFRQPFSLRHLLHFEIITLAVGVLPVSLIVLVRYNRLLRANLKLAREMNSELEPRPATTQSLMENTGHTEVQKKPETEKFTFVSESGTDQVTLASQDLLFAVAADNYVELYYRKNGATKKSLIRSSLTRLEEAVKTYPNLVRCHRAYLVNLGQVQNFSGNAQGLKLELNGTDLLIPVSRKMVPEIKTLLHG